MRYFITFALLLVLWNVIHSQNSDLNTNVSKKNTIYLELAGRAYLSLNYDRAWSNKDRISLGLGWNDLETNLDSLEAKEKGVTGDHEASPYLLFQLQYSRLIGQGSSFLELGLGSVITLFDLERFNIANNLYANESIVNIYPLVGYRYEGKSGLFFLFSFNPIIQIPQGYFWPIPGISLGYRF